MSEQTRTVVDATAERHDGIDVLRRALAQGCYDGTTRA